MSTVLVTGAGGFVGSAVVRRLARPGAELWDGTVIDRVGLEVASCECYGTVRRSFERLLPHTYVRDAKGGPRQQPQCS